jgi:lactocepin
VGAQQVVSVPADAYESDDTTTQAKVYPKRSIHTLDSYEDEDWMKLVVATAGTPYVFETQILSGNYDFDLHLYIYQQNPDGSVTMLDDRDDHEYWYAYSEYVTWTAPAAGTYYAVVMGHGSGETGTYAFYWDTGFARRVNGADRYMTAIEVSKLMYQQYTVSYDWDFDTSGIVIANGADFADAMAGGLLATAVDGPVLLSSPAKGLSGETRAEIGRILRPIVYYENDPVTIYILGGTAAVPAAVETQLKAIPEVASGIKNGNLTIMRINGATRFDTAAAVAAEVDDKIGVSDTVYVINGYAWADGLAVAAPSCWSISPVLLTTPGALSPATASAITSLGATKAIIVGGTAVVSPAVEAALKAQLGDANVRRISGDDRYKTALAVAEHAVDDVGLEGSRLILVSGENWPDALGAGPMVYQYEYDGGVEAPILLTRPARLSAEVAQFVNDYGHPDELCYVIGGPAALSDAVVSEFNKLRSAP